MLTIKIGKHLEVLNSTYLRYRNNYQIKGML